MILPIRLWHPVDDIPHLDHLLLLLHLSLGGVLQYRDKFLQGRPGYDGLLQLPMNKFSNVQFCKYLPEEKLHQSSQNVNIFNSI